MEKKELGREDVIEALKEIAFGRVNRGVELTYLSEQIGRASCRERV